MIAVVGAPLIALVENLSQLICTDTSALLVAVAPLVWIALYLFGQPTFFLA